MFENYALQVLRQEKETHKKKIEDMSELQRQGEKINKGERTKYFHRLKELDFAIEILESWEEER